MVETTFEQERERLTETGKSSAMEQKALLARGMDRVAKALHRTARDLQDENDPSTARYFDMAAEKIGHLSSSLEKRDLETLLAESRNYARKHPVIVFGGAMAAGLVASRFLKSSAGRRQQGWSQSRETAPEYATGSQPGTAGSDTKVENLGFEDVGKGKSRPYGSVKPGKYGAET
jgi:hypothetical protein